MTPGIYYLYEYKDNKKTRNVGFLKLTQHYQSCVLQISLRQIPVQNQEQVQLGVFFLEDSKAVYNTLLEIPCLNRAVSARVTVSRSDFPGDRTLQDVDGFFLLGPRRQIYAAAAANALFSPDTLTEWKEPVPEPKTEEDIHTSDALPETYSQSPTEFPQQEEENIPEEPLFSSESASSPESDIQVPDTDEANASDSEPEAAPEVQSDCVSEAPEGPIARKIQRSDMSSLPRRFWILANNSFLLHGYHNYHHLLLVEDEGQYWLGVPGIYDPKEARAAALFGFPQFTRDYADMLDLSEEECSTMEDFGYWCRWLKQK